MAKAVKAVKEKTMGLKKAVKMYSVPRSTLQRLCRIEKPIEEVINIKLGRPTIMPRELEEELVKYILVMESKFHGLTRNDVRRMALTSSVPKITSPIHFRMANQQVEHGLITSWHAINALYQS